MKWFSKKQSSSEQCLVDSGNQIKNNPGLPLLPGTQAPDFNLPSSTGDRISLSQYQGSPVILTFYPADWSRVCGDQLVLYNEVLPIFKQFNAVLMAISVDSTWSHKAFAEQRNLNFHLLSDFEPKGEVSRLYGVYNRNKGTSQRALFVVDSKGIIHWNYVSPDDINPGADGILRALESIQNQRSS